MAEANLQKKETKKKQIIVGRRMQNWLETIFIALLSAFLHQLIAYLGWFKLKDGGMITFALIPLFLIAFKNGAFQGIIAGLIFGFIVFLFPTEGHAWYVNAIYYLLGFGVVGVSGFFRYAFRGKRLDLVIGVFLAGILNYLIQSFTAFIFFDDSLIITADVKWYYWFVIYHFPIFIASTGGALILFLSLYKKLFYIMNQDF